MNHTTRKAFTLIDLSISMAIIAIAVVIVIPTASPTERLQLVGATNTLIADIEFAQSEALANPSDPAVVRFDFDNDSYWIARESDPDTPIIHPINAKPYLRQLNDQTAAVLDITLPSGGNTIAFNDFGSLTSGEDAVAHIASSLDEIWIVINVDTGFASAANIEPDIEDPPQEDPDPVDPPEEEEKDGGIILEGGGGGIVLGR
jgi:Tfp pilus assembly protein FimT